MEVGGGFEPPKPVKVCQFSRLERSTTLPTHHIARLHSADGFMLSSVLGDKNSRAAAGQGGVPAS